MTTMDGTVPRPPAMAPANDAPPADIRAFVVSLLTVMLVAVPVAVAWTVGFLARCFALIYAATLEAYLAGRGPRE